MITVLAINGSPRMSRSRTALLLSWFLRGMETEGAQVRTVYASALKAKPCDCGEMRCWFRHPGDCYWDDLPEFYDAVRKAEILVLASPVYVPLPGAFQELLNRLTPLMEPAIVTRHDRTRARFREDVAVRKIVAVSTGGWWEKENFDSFVRIVREVADSVSVEFAGAILRPHVDAMWRQGEITDAGEAVLRAAESAGRELVRRGSLDGSVLDAVCRPLVSRATYNRWFSQSVAAALTDSAE
jgi:multimeric flavodoxin WrbA